MVALPRHKKSVKKRKDILTLVEKASKSTSIFQHFFLIWCQKNIEKALKSTSKYQNFDCARCDCNPYAHTHLYPHIPNVILSCPIPLVSLYVLTHNMIYLISFSLPWELFPPKTDCIPTHTHLLPTYPQSCHFLP